MLSIPSAANTSHHVLKPSTPARPDPQAAAAAAARAGAEPAAAQPPNGEAAVRDYKPPESPLRDLQLPFSVGYGAGRAAPAGPTAQQQAAAAAAAAALTRETVARSGYVVPPALPGSRVDTSA